MSIRALPVLLAALLAAALSALAAPAAPAAKSCRPGTFVVRVERRGTATTVCASARGRAGTPAQLTARLRAQVRTPRQLRAALPARWRARLPLAKLTKVDRLLDRAAAARLRRWTAPAAASATARAAASGGANACNERPTFEIDPVRSSDGAVRAVSSGGGWVAGSGSTAGRLVIVDADAGNGTRAVQTTKDCISWDPCPDANGIVHGTYEYTLKEEYTATTSEGVARFGSIVSVTAKLTARVGDDARVTTYDWDADGRTEHFGGISAGGKVVRHIPTRITRVHVRVRGVDPRDRDGALRDPYAAARGNKGAITSAELPAAQAVFDLATVVLRGTAGEALLEAESHWYRGKCLTAVFDPDEPEVTPGQRVDVSIRVRGADGEFVEVPLELTPLDGAVGPPTGRSPTTVVWTAPQQLDRGVFTTFEVTSTSKRGRLEGYHTAKAARRAPAFRMTFSGAGSYSRHEMGTGLPQVDARHTFEWRSTTTARFPFLDDLPAGVPTFVNTDSTELTGQLRGWRTDGGGTSGCSSTPESENAVGVVRQTRTADGGFDMAISPFPWLHPLGGIQPDCDTGAFLFWSKGTTAAMTFSFHLSKADLDSRDLIVLDARPQNPLAADCWGGEANGDWECEQSVAWNGTVRLERLATR